MNSGSILPLMENNQNKIVDKPKKVAKANSNFIT